MKNEYHFKENHNLKCIDASGKGCKCRDCIHRTPHYIINHLVMCWDCEENRYCRTCKNKEIEKEISEERKNKMEIIKNV